MSKEGRNCGAARKHLAQTDAVNAAAEWPQFCEAMYALTQVKPRTDLIPEEAAHRWLERLGLLVPDPTCGRGR